MMMSLKFVKDHSHNFNNSDIDSGNNSLTNNSTSWVKPMNTFTITYDALCYLVPFVQFKKRKKHLWRSVTFSIKSNTPPWAFFHFFKLYEWYQIAQSISSLVRNFFQLVFRIVEFLIRKIFLKEHLVNKLTWNKHVLQLHLKRDYNNGHRAFHIKIQMSCDPWFCPLHGSCTVLALCHVVLNVQIHS